MTRTNFMIGCLQVETSRGRNGPIHNINVSMDIYIVYDSMTTNTNLLRQLCTGMYLLSQHLIPLTMMILNLRPRMLYMKLDTWIQRLGAWDQHDTDHCPQGQCPLIEILTSEELPYTPCITPSAEEVLISTCNTKRFGCWFREETLLRSPGTIRCFLTAHTAKAQFYCLLDAF